MPLDAFLSAIYIYRMQAIFKFYPNLGIKDRGHNE